jgi:protocatechuate 3,4-dioxygenase beta subunit
MYSSGVTGENYLRGVQEADANGVVTFTTIFPGCYAGRMPHVHFEVYPSVAKATSAANRIKTSQFTFPMAALNEAYAVSGYEASVRNLAGISYATDNVFNDGTSLQMVSITGSPAAGYVATLSVGVHL